ncbi:MAG TPA: hypothetical protein VG323_08295 [Thermoanaerobaculia bacterium]|nr:hypothetical protein [Thermoanaerobaculia bacterium]
MIAYYALGGGLGHATRARRVLDALGIDDAVIVASVRDERVTGRYPVVDSLRGLEPERIIADAFPLGLFGELAEAGVPLDYVARLLRWDEYRRCVPHPLPRFGTTYVVEPVRHEVPCEQTIELDLHGDRQECLSSTFPYWLVVHSGPEQEVRDLVAYAEELQRIERDTTPIVVVSQCGIGIDVVPASSLFAGAARIISAAGFNVMLETEPYRDKHHVVPMPRRFDDQFARAARRRYDSSSRICAAR